MPGDYVKHYVKEGYYSVKELQELINRMTSSQTALDELTKQAQDQGEYNG